jgi:thiol-disulfide isomerase/thioredoxin
MAFALLIGSATVAAGRDEPPPAQDKKNKRPDIYDGSADAAAQIEQALKIAKRDNKRVLLQFGANWCGWCHKLHELIKTDQDIKKTLSFEYEVVMIDVDNRGGPRRNQAVNDRYGNPIKHGLPVLVVLDADGKQLVTQETGSLEKGAEHDPAKVLAFLNQWKPSPASAEEALTTALSQAKRENKRVFVQFSAPWCGWCHKLSDYLSRDDVSKVFTAAFVPVKIDVDRMTGGADLNRKHGGEKQGLPFFVILDADAKALADSKGPEGNVGCPVAPAEIAHFIKVVRQTAPRLNNEQIAILENGLKQLGSSLRQ